MTLFEQYQAKSKEIQRDRVLAWVAPNSKVEGFTLTPVTIRSWLDLEAVGNAFVCGGEPKPEHVFQYLVRHHPRYKLGRIGKWRVGRKIKKQMKTSDGQVDLLLGIYEHFDSAFDELPQSSKKSSARDNRLPYAHGAISMVDEIASRYGIDPALVFDKPLQQIFALQKCLRKATIADYELLEPQSLRDIKSEYLTQKNKENGEKS